MRFKSKTTIFISLTLFLVAFSTWGLNSKWVVDLAFSINDPATEAVYQPEEGPLQFDHTIGQWDSMKLSGLIEQPSGLTIHQDSMMLTTDKAEFLTLDSSGKVQNTLQLNSLPLLLRQGFAEGVACVNLNECYVSAGETMLFKIERHQDTWQFEEFLSLQDQLPAGLEMQGLALDPEKEVLYVGFIHGQQIQVWDITISTKTIQKRNIDINSVAIKQGRQLDELEIVGLSFDSGTLYALAGPANVLFSIDSDQWLVNKTIGLEGLNDSSGMSVFNNRLYVITDHEYYEPLPPLLSANL